ncbi:arsenite methyltransferase [Longivirga aurantiaca]|uniref:Arsenite methyltransferase n=1 Tax=Longivirga aurantiaca TaxID=1837743 RepID=A0ABW1SXA5_9ACTN
MNTPTADEVRAAVREHYGRAAEQSQSCGCATTSTCCDSTPATAPFGAALYDVSERSELPEAAVLASLGCGNPTALAELSPGEVVLDLGSGGGIDVLLSARRVGPTGKAYGLDMTPEMHELAVHNQAVSGVSNAEFLTGTIEDIPLPDESVDVIISNCVVNLSPDKPAVLREAFRVLRPGGRLAISDVVLRRPLSAEDAALMDLWVSCISGAMLEEDMRAGLVSAGFVDVDIEPVRIYTGADLESMAGGWRSDQPDAEIRTRARDELDGVAMSAFIRATRPT